MILKKTYQINQLRDYSTLFSRSEVNKLLKKDFNSIDMKIQRYDGYLNQIEFNYIKYLKHIYKILKKFYPNEYIYKNEFLNKWLINEIGSSNSVVFNEFRIGKAIADLVIFNGTSRVFEIKTILDKEYRLSNQLVEYKKIFNEINLIIPLSKLDKYVNYDINIGIITYDDTMKKFSYYRKPKKNIIIDCDTIMEVLHTNEYKKIVKNYYGELPNFTDFNQFEICKQLIKKIPIIELNSLFISTMKNRKINNNFFKTQNIEFNQICLSLNLTDKQKEILFNNLNSTISY